MKYLGIDVGSVSTDFVVIDEKNNVLKKIYLKTEGNPIKAVSRGMELLAHDFKTCDISGAGTTGSGRAIAAMMIGADTVKNEITAHGKAAASLYPDVKTIFEIGGQDSKIILLKDGFIRDFAMNTVCAAGTGSFLDRQAERMGLKTSEMGELAVKADMPVMIAGRCAVFAESDIIHKQQMGVSAANLLAGMCKALVRSYMNNVAKGKKLEPTYCFQGGVSCNAGIKKAFEEELGESVIVPEHNTVMGAVGAAILARENIGKNKTTFKGFNAALRDVHTEEFTCTGCSNSCRVVKIISEGRQLGCFQDKCGRYQTDNPA